MIFNLLNTKVFTQEFVNSNNAEINHLQAVANPTIGDGEVYVSWSIIESNEPMDLSDEYQKAASVQLVIDMRCWCDAEGYRLWSY